MQEFISSHSSPFGRRLTAGLCAIALVSSLAFYQRMVIADPLNVTQQHWQAIMAENSDLTLSRYHENAVILWFEGLEPRRYQGKEITKAWQRFFQDYQVQNYRILHQKEENDRFVKAEVILTTELAGGRSKMILVSYTAQIDAQGKITREIWQATPQFSV
jgi:hypothetical protein